MTEPKKIYRYPGINAFEEAQKDRFHGRRMESEQQFYHRPSLWLRSQLFEYIGKICPTHVDIIELKS
jgi:hypothetical protein